MKHAFEVKHDNLTLTEKSSYYCARVSKVDDLAWVKQILFEMFSYCDINASQYDSGFNSLLEK